MRKVDKRSKDYKTKAQLKKERKLLKKQSQMEKKFLVGLYDDYRKDGILNDLFSKVNCKLIGTYSTEPIYTMHYLKDDESCGVKINGNHSIKVEVWEVNETAIDRIERGYNYYTDFEEYPQDYKKEKVLSPFGEITMYFIEDIKPEDKVIVSGDWIEYLNYKKVIGDKKLTT